MKKPTTGQGTVELMLLLPIVMGLLTLTIQAYQSHRDASQTSIDRYGQFLTKFDYGRGSGAVTVDGIEYVPNGGLEELFPPWRDLTDAALDHAIDSMLNRVKFMDGTNVVTGYINGYSRSVTRDLVHSGKVNWDAAQRAGIVGSFSSNQATDVLQGSSKGLHEFFGSGAQAALIAYGEGKFKDPKAIWGGAAGGLLTSNAAENWLGSGDHQLLKGAGKGAISGVIAGASQGKLQAKQILAASAMGGLNTNSVAKHFPWQNGISDPKQATSFLATNAAIATLVSGGNAKEAMISATQASFFGRQLQGKVTGNGSKTSQWIRKTSASTVFKAAEVSARGGDAAAVGASAMESVISGVTPLGYHVASKGVKKALSHVVDVESAKKAVRKVTAVPQAAMDMAEYVGSLKFIEGDAP